MEDFRSKQSKSSDDRYITPHRKDRAKHLQNTNCHNTEHNTNLKSVTIIGDIILNNIYPHEISKDVNIGVKRQQPDAIILHNNNDIRTYGGHTKIMISLILSRQDKGENSK